MPKDTPIHDQTAADNEKRNRDTEADAARHGGWPTTDPDDK